MESKSLNTLALRCAARKIPASEFLNLYKEFYNETFPANSIDNDDAKTQEGSGSQDKTDVEESISKPVGSKNDPVAILCAEFMKLLENGKYVILADYVVEVLFVNYHSELVREFLPKLKDLMNKGILIHFFSKSCAFFVNLTDNLVISQLIKDLRATIVPCILETNFCDISNELVVAIAKFLQAVLRFTPQPIQINSETYRDNTFNLTKRLSLINKILSKKFAGIIDKKLQFKEVLGPFTKDSTLDFENSPSITSPQFIPSPLPSMKERSVTSSQSAIKYKDLKLLRYYKNIWLNSKLMNWQPFDSEFISNYSAIKSSLYPDQVQNIQNVDLLFTDLIETAFTCFAQFVSNKLYHQSNSTYNLLERKWILFLSKILPLLVYKNSSRTAHVIGNALDGIDDKVIKAISAYYQENDDGRSRNDDLFDDYPSTSLDIRHDFIKSLTMLGVVPPVFITNYLRGDQTVDSKALATTDDLTFTNQQGIIEIVNDIPNFIRSSLEGMEMENVSEPTLVSSNGLLQVLSNFDTVSPTKQFELANAVVDMLSESSTTFELNTFVKLTAVLTFNYSHSLTSILMYVTPEVLTKLYLEFVDKHWNSQVLGKQETDGESQFENVNISMSFSWAILMLTILYKQYHIDFVSMRADYTTDNIKNSFAITFVENLPDISDLFFIDEKNSDDPEVQVKSHKLVRDWLNDLFVNGSLSDSLLQNIEPKQLAILVPYIFKQVTLAMEIGAVGDLQNLIGGFEYFLQPFMLVGLIKVMYWLEQYLSCLKSDETDEKVIQKVLSLLNTIICPSTLNEDSKAFHFAVLRLNAIPLLGILYQFRSNKHAESNYGIYSSDNEGNPTLELMISRLISSLSISPVYDIDSTILVTDNNFVQKPPKFQSFFVTNEISMNKMLTNQMNSFWSLHSSTYYNLDFLKTLIDTLTPKQFLLDVLRTLEYKVETLGVKDVRNKSSSNESDQVIDYLFYFLVLYDIENSEDAKAMAQFMEDTVDISINGDSGIVKQETQPKSEYNPDDDIDMLFGENDTSMQANEEDTLDNKELKSDRNCALGKNRHTFGFIIHEIKLSYGTLESDSMSYEDYKKICEYHSRYLKMLKTCIF
ncbi:hypothetical protein B1J92_E05060g [Nakaseomyces glabratus]|nr:hypothetical protein B1J91_E05060g [Nakaseomyces glabratus]OXB49743.1 hypothetical protein B1J92_E05060g [Nakaseomyces glabratus]